MEEERPSGVISKGLGSLISTMRRLLFTFMSSGPIPQHIAFIMDGNRRFAKKWKLEEGAGHKAGFLALLSVLKYCYEVGVKYVTVYAFSLDNFNRRPDEVQYVMDIMYEKIQGFLKEMDMVNRYGVRVLFIGDLNRLDEPVRIAAEKAMEATAKNTKTYLLVCVAYTSSHEIPRAIYEACQEKSGLALASNRKKNNNDDDGIVDEDDVNDVIKVADLEKHMYMGVVPDPDILVRSSGETRLSNFLLWQSTNSLLYSPKALWPEMGFWQVVWGILKYQNKYYYLEKKKKQA
uniref:Alkyl transferase n=1 Tax=Parthenium argentatum TaxID=35935 RepID=A0A384WD08_PARAR|nr:cis-prenyltransferase 2 [Parthenium argentatum]ATD87119.1 cis-prenyltransferase 2 [synthetic construct]BCU09028.1 cis-prenyltransferase [synthetic construct]